MPTRSAASPSAQKKSPTRLLSKRCPTRVKHPVNFLKLVYQSLGFHHSLAQPSKAKPNPARPNDSASSPRKGSSYKFPNCACRGIMRFVSRPFRCTPLLPSVWFPYNSSSQPRESCKLLELEVSGNFSEGSLETFLAYALCMGGNVSPLHPLL